MFKKRKTKPYLGVCFVELYYWQWRQRTNFQPLELNRTLQSYKHSNMWWRENTSGQNLKRGITCSLRTSPQTKSVKMCLYFPFFHIKYQICFLYNYLWDITKWPPRWRPVLVPLLIQKMPIDVTVLFIHWNFLSKYHTFKVFQTQSPLNNYCITF